MGAHHPAATSRRHHHPVVVLEVRGSDAPTTGEWRRPAVTVVDLPALGALRVSLTVVGVERVPQMPTEVTAHPFQCRFSLRLHVGERARRARTRDLACHHHQVIGLRRTHRRHKVGLRGPAAPNPPNQAILSAFVHTYECVERSARPTGLLRNPTPPGLRPGTDTPPPPARAATQSVESSAPTRCRAHRRRARIERRSSGARLLRHQDDGVTKRELGDPTEKHCDHNEPQHHRRVGRP